MPETKRHLRLRTLLFQILELAFADRASVGCDQFVYWDPTDPRACLAPDAFVHFGEPDHDFSSWKVWERGAPQLAVEIISESDERDSDWAGKLEKYRRLGVRELVRFDEASAEQPLRLWECVDQDLVERRVPTSVARSSCVPGFWVVVPADSGLALRLAHDERGQRLFPTPAERADEGRLAAERRVAELEAQLRL